jgi:hypothetical protein
LPVWHSGNIFDWIRLNFLERISHWYVILSFRCKIIEFNILFHYFWVYFNRSINFFLQFLKFLYVFWKTYFDPSKVIWILYVWFYEFSSLFFFRFFNWDIYVWFVTSSFYFLLKYIFNCLLHVSVIKFMLVYHISFAFLVKKLLKTVRN